MVQRFFELGDADGKRPDSRNRIARIFGRYASWLTLYRNVERITTG